MSTETQQAPDLDNTIADVIEGGRPAEKETIQPPEPELPELEAFPMWDKETKDAWKALNGYKDGRAHLERLHKSFGNTQGYITRIEQAAAQMRRQFDPLNEFLKPYSQQWAQEGMDPVSGLRQIMAFRDGLMTNPQETLIALARMTGVDLSQAIADQPYVDPQVIALQNRIAQMEDSARQAQTTQQRQHEQFVLGQVQAFETEKDSEGNLKHPHFSEVLEDMLFLYQQGRASSPQDAYELAVRLNPKFQEQAAKEASEKAIREANEKNLAVAQTLAKSGVAKPGPARGSDKGLSLDDVVRDVLKST